MAGFVRATTGVAFNGSSVTVAPTSGGGLTGDVRYVFAATNVASLTMTTGWTQLFNAQLGGGAVGLWWKPVVAAETSAFVNLASVGDGVVIILSLAAASTTGTPQSTTNSGSGTTLTATGLTPTVTNDVELAFFSTQVTANATTMTLSTPTGMSVGNTYRPTTAAGIVGMVGYRQLTSTAATGSSTSTASTTGTWRTATAVHPPGPVVTGATPGGFMSFFPSL